MLALLYDVHGNLPALEAVIADAEAAGARGWILGGDYALFGGWPAETVARLRELEPATWIRGNGERWTADPDAAPDNAVVPGAVAAAREALGAGGRGRPRLAAVLLPARGHADLPRLAAERRALVRARRAGDDDAELLAGTDAPRVVFGHTHLPFARTAAGGIELVNPGSVGMPFDGDPRAAYALLADDGRIEHRRVGYDHRASADRVRSLGGQWAEVVARRIELAVMDV